MKKLRAKEALSGWPWVGKINSDMFIITLIKLCYNYVMNDVYNDIWMIDVIVCNGDEFLMN